MRYITKFASFLAGLAVLVAGIGIGPNSVWFCYEPDIPRSLKDKD
ncbi:MAG: cyclic lactone autoinducer peptide [Peptococcaceae bacterium]